MELPALLALAAAVPAGRWRAAMLGLAGAALGLATLVKLADMGTFAALARPVNPLLDVHFLGNLWHLGVGNFGLAVTLALIAGGLAALLLGAFALAGALRGVARIASGRPARRALVGALAVALVGVGLAEIRLVPAQHDRWVHPHTSLLAYYQTRSMATEMADLAAFRDRLAAMPEAPARGPGRALNRLGEADVVLIFIESLGRTAVTRAPFRDTVRPQLAAIGDAARAVGAQARTHWLRSPTVGGQSWLAHTSALSGLAVTSQQRYRWLLQSEATTLIDDFNNAGYETVAVMPAITQSWPPGERLGYDRVLDAGQLDYAGSAYNWVTMPDQFTLQRLRQRVLNAGPGDGPVFAEVALISSHAPFVPVPPVLAWESIDDGRIFNRWADDGPDPGAVWQDPERLKHHYRQALAYSLASVAAFLREEGAEDRLYLIMGDHEAAPMVTGHGDSRAVPAVAVSAEGALLAPFAQAGWQPGAVPADDASTQPMQKIRELFRRGFTIPAEPPSSAAAAPAP